MSHQLEKNSPCKVNLILNILRRRADGFHELETVLQPVNLFDRLSFTRRGREIRLACSEPTLPTDASNLVHRAASAFLLTAGISEGVEIQLEKKIPMAAGLGGGSGNAATTLLALNEIFERPLSPAHLQEIATSLGSDIPFFLQDNPALAIGRGELLTSWDPFPALKGAAFLLIYPGFGIATAWAYKELTRYPKALNGEPGRARKLIQVLQTRDLAAAGANLYNSLEGPALEKHPLLALYQEFLRAEGAPAVLMSGSGSTTFAIARSQAEARRLENRLLERFGPCWTAVVAV